MVKVVLSNISTLPFNHLNKYLQNVYPNQIVLTCDNLNFCLFTEPLQEEKGG